MNKWPSAAKVTLAQSTPTPSPSSSPAPPSHIPPSSTPPSTTLQSPSPTGKVGALAYTHMCPIYKQLMASRDFNYVTPHYHQYIA